MSDSFSQTHPVTGFLFFLSAIGFSMFFMHPVCVVISLCASFAYSLLLGGKRLLLFFLRFLLPTALLISTALFASCSLLPAPSPPWTMPLLPTLSHKQPATTLSCPLFTSFGIFASGFHAALEAHANAG